MHQSNKGKKMSKRLEEMVQELLDEVQEMKSMLVDHVDSHQEVTMVEEEILADDEFDLEDADSINEALQSGVYALVWNSTSGEKSMDVTLDSDEVPAEEHDMLEESIFQNGSNNLLKVWSPDRNGWRSFYVADIVSMNPVE